MEGDSDKNSREMINNLINKLYDNDGFVREKARLALIDFGGEAVPSLIKALESSQEQVRWEAAKALVKIANQGSTASLVKALQDEVFDIRWLAAEALIAIGAGSVKPLLAALVDEPKELFLRQGAHHVIKDIIHQNPKESELNEILKSVESALDSTVPSITISGAAKIALEKLKTLYHS
jgi:HEAT repeat protein